MHTNREASVGTTESCRIFLTNNGACPFGQTYKYDYDALKSRRAASADNNALQTIMVPKKLDSITTSSHTTSHSFNCDAWRRELSMSCPNRDYILEGVREGFNIVDPSAIKVHSKIDNHKSATSGPLRPLVEEQMKFQLSHGHYQYTDEDPMIISALGALPLPGPTSVSFM